MGIADAGHVRVGKQEVECDGQEGQVSHQGEVLPTQYHMVQPVWERQPIQSLARTLQVGVSNPHGQIIFIQTLKKRDGQIYSTWYQIKDIKMKYYTNPEQSNIVVLIISELNFFFVLVFWCAFFFVCTNFKKENADAKWNITLIWDLWREEGCLLPEKPFHTLH